MISKLLQLLMLASLVNTGLGQSSLSESNSTKIQTCDYFGNQTKMAHVGWPFQLRCSDGLLSNLGYKVGRKLNISCTIKEADGTVLWSSTFLNARKLKYAIRDYPRINVTDSFNATYSIEITVPHEGFCGVSEVAVVGEHYKANYNCSTLPSTFGATEEYTLGDQIKEIKCGIARSDPIKLYGDSSEYTYEWWYNCSKTLPSNVAVKERTPQMIRFSNVSFSNGGEYVCAVRYGNQTRILFRYNVCVQRRSVTKVTMNCPARVGGKEGSKLDITCFMDGGIGRIGIFYPAINWFNVTKSQKGVPICFGYKHFATRADIILNNDSVKCINSQPEENIFNQTKTCFRYPPPPELDVRLKARYNITLQIKNLREWDVGNYTVTHWYSMRPKSRTIEVYLDKSGTFMDSSIKAAVGVAITVVLILLLIISCWKRHDILWFYKKYFGPYEKERKSHDVVLVYHYSRDDMKLRSKLQTEKFIKNLEIFLNERALTFYDENREDGDFQLQVQNVAKILDDCHRILIFLNEEIAFDEWNLHKVYSAIKGSAKKGADVIFISVPGLKKKFHNAPNKSQVALKHLMKIGTTIDWSGRVPFDNSFKRRLEYALPKKPRNRHENVPSPARALTRTAV